MTKRKTNIFMTLLVTMLFIGMAAKTVSAQQNFEEIAVGFEIPRLINADMVVQYDGQDVFVPLLELFNRLGIHIEPNFDKQKFSGRYFKKNKKYSVDMLAGEATALGYTTKLMPDDYNFTDYDLFLKLSVMKEIFELDLKFDFGSLKIILQLDTDYPAYLRLKREEAHRTLLASKPVEGKYKEINPGRSYLSGATLDWTLSASPIGNNKIHYADLTLGSVVMGGDLALSGTGNTAQGFQPDQISYRWHYSMESNKYVRQIDIGRLSTPGTISRSLTGIKLTNQAQNRRQYFQTIKIDGQLAEGWEVELHINNKLHDYVIVGPSGNYNFDLDIFYGSSRVLLKKFGPNGEIETEERFISVPYNLIPKKTFEYSLVTGSSQAIDSSREWHAATSAHYGLLNNMTVGFTHELPLVSSSPLGQQISSNVTYQPFGDLTLSAVVAPGYSQEMNMTFSRPSLFSSNGRVAFYNTDSPRNVTRKESSLSFNISAPFKVGSSIIGARYSVSFDKLLSQNTINMNYGLNSSFWKFHISYMGNHKISKSISKTDKATSSKLLLTSSLFRFVRPQFRIDYDHSKNSITSMAVYMSKRIFKSAQISLSLVRNVATDINQVSFSFDIYNSFARFSSKVLGSGGQVSMSQSQKGSIKYNNVDKSIDFSRDNAVGFGAAVLRPFADDNYNGTHDEGEEYLSNTRVDIRGLSGQSTGSRNSHTYGKLRPYFKYKLQVDPASLDNPLMRPVYENYEITFNPNVVTSIDVPLAMGSEVSGHIQRKTVQGMSGVGGIKLMFYNLANESVIEVTTFINGDFYFLGLLPGKYLVHVDQNQLDQYGYQAEPKDLELDIKPEKGGSIIEDVIFTLSPKPTKAELDKQAEATPSNN